MEKDDDFAGLMNVESEYSDAVIAKLEEAAVKWQQYADELREREREASGARLVVSLPDPPRRVSA